MNFVDARPNRDLSRVFGLSAAQFAWVVLLAPTLSVGYLGQHVTYLLAALFFWGGLGFLVSKFIPQSVNSQRVAIFAGLGIIVSMMAVKISLQGLEFTAMPFSGYAGHDLPMDQTAWVDLVKLFVATGISSFCYSIFLGYALDRISIESETVYSYELIGSLLGMVLAVVLVQCGQWWYATGLILAFVLFALTPSFWSDSLRHWSTVAIFLGLIPFFAMWLEPKLKVNYSARDFADKFKVEQLEKKWDVHSSVQLLKVSDAGHEGRKISVGNGLSIIHVENYSTEAIPAEMQFAAYFRPNQSLILFAGAGNEILAMRKLNPSAQSIVGVELSKNVIQMGGFYSEPIEGRRVDHLLAGEARGFLERDENKYDQIIFSWSGAGVVHSPGAAFQTTSYVYTKEGIHAAFSRLHEDGVLIFFGGPIYQIGLALEELVGKSLRDLTLVFGFLKRRRNLASEWDNRIVIFKKNGFVDGDRENLQKLAATKWGERPIMELDSEVEPYYRTQVEPNSAANELIRLKTDDNPFVYARSPSRNTRIGKFALLAAVVWLGLLFGPLLFSRRETLSSKIQKSGVLWVAGILGISFSILWIFLMYKFLLILGVPTLALVAFYFSNGIGQYLCFRSLRGLCVRHLLYLSYAGLGVWIFLIFVTSTLSLDLLHRSILSACLLLIVLSTGASFLTAGFFLSLIRLSKCVLERRSVFASNLLFSGVLLFVSVYLIRDIGLNEFAKWGIGGYALAGLVLLAMDKTSKKNGGNLVGQSLT